MFELESEIDYAFVPVCFETIFRNGLITNSFKTELLAFKQETDNIPADIWDWEYIGKHETWLRIKYMATGILDKLGIQNRVYTNCPVLK